MKNWKPDPDEMHELKQLMITVLDLLELERKQQLELNDHSHSALNKLDEIIGSYQESDSIFLVVGALRASFTAKLALKNWKPLLEHALAKWPNDRNVFRGLIK